MFEFGVHSLGSVLCKRKRCSANKKDSKGSSAVYSVSKSGKHSQNSLNLRKENFSLLSSHHRSNLKLSVYKIFREFGEHSKHLLKYVKMADSRRQTRSIQRRGSQTDAQFWSNQPDPLLIERGQADAI